MALASSVQELVQAYKHRLLAACGSNILEIRVFGSRARGDARADSDLDVFVMVDTDDRRVWSCRSPSARSS